MNKIQKGGLKYGSSTDKNNCTLRVHNFRNKNDGKKANKRFANLGTCNHDFNFKHSGNPHAKHRTAAAHGNNSDFGFDMLRNIGVFLDAEKFENKTTHLRKADHRDKRRENRPKGNGIFKIEHRRPFGAAQAAGCIFAGRCLVCNNGNERSTERNEKVRKTAPGCDDVKA